MERALGERRERAHLLDLVAEELDAERLAAGAREDVDEPAAHRDLPALLDPLDALRSRRARALDERVEPDLVSDATRIGSGRASSGGMPSASARAEAQTRPPAASTASARARSPTRCAGGSSPESQRDAAARKERDAARVDVPADGLGGVARVLVLRERPRERGRRPEAVLVQRREDERQRGLGDRARCAGGVDVRRKLALGDVAARRAVRTRGRRVHAD